jgi:hypothetical protein
MWLVAAILFLAAISFGIALHQERENKKVLQHTIAVNLSILRSELRELSKIAEEAAQDADVRKAKTLLAMSEALAGQVEEGLEDASERELGDKLGLAFQAMNLATRARHLLKAIE